jgi:hypothetical protein
MPARLHYSKTRIRESELFKATDAMAMVFDEPEGVGHRLHRQLDQILSHVSEDEARNLANESENKMRRGGILRRDPRSPRRSIGRDKPINPYPWELV